MAKLQLPGSSCALHPTAAVRITDLVPAAGVVRSATGVERLVPSAFSSATVTSAVWKLNTESVAMLCGPFC